MLFLHVVRLRTKYGYRALRVQTVRESDVNPEYLPVLRTLAEGLTSHAVTQQLKQALVGRLHHTTHRHLALQRLLTFSLHFVVYVFVTFVVYVQPVS